MRVPSITGVETAVLMYYEKISLSTEDVRKLFGCSQSAAYKLKQMCGGGKYVKTDDAYDKWGLDISDLEARLIRIKKLKEV